VADLRSDLQQGQYLLIEMCEKLTFYIKENISEKDLILAIRNSWNMKNKKGYDIYSIDLRSAIPTASHVLFKN